jgi:hypothetical protein
MHAAYMFEKCDAHAHQLLAIHAFAGLVNTRSLLALIPNGVNDFCRRGDGCAWSRLVIHAIGIVLVNHIVFGLDPFMAIRDLEAGAACVSSTGSHVVHILGSDEHEGFG